ncbi:hypothetical protein TNCV_2870821 [Trichonephila clavipes]|nr:hypothetical protein TNCV_2870821 [Trichonephila clavipes]
MVLKVTAYKGVKELAPFHDEFLWPRSGTDNQVAATTFLMARLSKLDSSILTRVRGAVTTILVVSMIRGTQSIGAPTRVIC